MDFILSIITFTFVTILSTVIILHNPKSWTNRLFLILCYIINLSIIVNYFSLHPIPPTATTQLFWIRIVMFVSSFIGPILILFVHTFPDDKIKLSKIYIIALLFFGFLSGILSLTKYIFVSIEYHNNMPLPIPGSGMIFFLVDYLGLFILSFIILIFRYIKAKNLLRIRLLILLIGTVMTFSLMGFVTVTLVVFAKESSAVLFGPISSAILMFVLAYAIIRYRFFGIHFQIEKRRAKIFLIIVSCAMYLLGVGSFYFLFDHMIVLSVGVLLLVLFSKMYSKWIFRKIDNIFFQNHLDLSKCFSEDVARLNSTHELHTYLLGLSSRIQSLVKAEVQMIFVPQRQHNRFWSYYPNKSNEIIFFDEPYILYIENNENIAISIKSTKNKELIRCMKKYKSKLILVTKKGKKINGLLFLSAKFDKNDFSKKEIDELIKIANSAGNELSALIYWYETIEGMKRKLHNDVYEI